MGHTYVHMKHTDTLRRQSQQKKKGICYSGSVRHPRGAHHVPYPKHQPVLGVGPTYVMIRRPAKVYS